MHVHENEAGADLLWQGCFFFVIYDVKITFGQSGVGGRRGSEAANLESLIRLRQIQTRFLLLPGGGGAALLAAKVYNKT